MLSDRSGGGREPGSSDAGDLVGELAGAFGVEGLEAGEDSSGVVEAAAIDDHHADVIAADLALERARITAGDDPSVVDHDDVVGPIGQLDVVAAVADDQVPVRIGEDLGGDQGGLPRSGRPADAQVVAGVGDREADRPRHPREARRHH